MRCSHNYVYTQGHFYCTKCGHRTYGGSYRRKKSKKIALTILGIIVAIGVFYVYGNQSIISDVSEATKNISTQFTEITKSLESEFELEKITKDIETEFEELTESLETDPKETALLIHELINEERKKHGLKQLGWHPKLVSAATKHSNDMMNRGYYSHDSPEGYDFVYRYSIVGFSCEIPIGGNQYSLGAENINYLEGYYGKESIARNAVDGWMESSGHRKNILTKYFQNEGIGVAISGRTVYATQNFC